MDIKSGGGLGPMKTKTCKAGTLFRFRDPEKGIITFHAGRPKRVESLQEGEFPAVWAEHSTEFRLADGSRFWGTVWVCETDSGEHYGTTLFLQDGSVAFQEDSDFLAKLGREKGEVFPYKYRPLKPIAGDIHCGEDGWSQH